MPIDMAGGLHEIMATYPPGCFERIGAAGIAFSPKVFIVKAYRGRWPELFEQVY